MSKQYPERVLRILRQRIGGYDDEFNTDLDEKCQALSPEEVMAHLMAWELGDPDWWKWVVRRLEWVGLKVVPIEED